MTTEQIEHPNGGDKAADLTIGHVGKNTRERLRVSLSEFRGKRYISVREWFVDDDEIERPSKRGVNIRVDRLEDFAGLVELAIAEARGRGWLRTN